MNPARPTTAPRAVKTMEKPTTKLSEWRNMVTRLLAALVSNISGPARLAKYTGTRGSTQGDTKEAIPAAKAIKNDVCSIVYVIISFNAN